MTGVLVDFPIEEAEAILGRLEEPPLGKSDVDLDAAGAGYRRLARAVKVERGPSGNAEERPTVAEQAEALIGRDVLVSTIMGGHIKGRLAAISATDKLILETGPTSHQPIAISMVRTISADLGEAA
jgi:hypothetical protein